MKGNTFLDKEKKEIIESYSRKGNNIVVKMADKKTIILPYSEELYSKLDSTQKEQYKAYNEKQIDIAKNNILGSVVIFIFGSMIAVSILSVSTIVGLLLIGLLFIATPVSLIKILPKLNHLKKQKLFMENSDIYTDEIFNNKSVKENFSSSKLKKFHEQKKIDLNSIDNMSMKDLKMLKEIVETECNLQSDDFVNSPKVLSKKKS